MTTHRSDGGGTVDPLRVDGPLANYPRLYKIVQLLDEVVELIHTEQNQAETLDAADELHTAGYSAEKARRLVVQAAEAEDGA